MSSGIYVYLSIQWMLHHVPLKAKLDNCTAVCVECFWYTTHLILFFFCSPSHTSNRKQNKARNWYLFTLHTRLHSPRKCSSRFLNNYETFDWKLPHYYVFFTNGRTYFKEAAPPPSQKQKIVPWKKDKKNTIIYSIYTRTALCVCADVVAIAKGPAIAVEKFDQGIAIPTSAAVRRARRRLLRDRRCAVDL